MSAAASEIEREPDTRGVFLSAAALERVRHIFERRNEYLRDPDGVFRAEFVAKLFTDDEWPSFDEVYVALYALNLVDGRSAEQGAGFIPRAERDWENRGTVRGYIEFLLDIKFKKFDPSAVFEDTLINEYAVADVVNFRDAAQDLLPYSLALNRVGLGCVYLEFAILSSAPLAKELPDGWVLPQLGKTTFENDPGWAELKSRYKVSENELRRA